MRPLLSLRCVFADKIRYGSFVCIADRNVLFPEYDAVAIDGSDFIALNDE